MTVMVKIRLREKAIKHWKNGDENVKINALEIKATSKILITSKI